MKKAFTSKNEIVINAPAAKVWEGLTNPEIIKQYLFGTNTVTDWKVGSPIFWRGEWEGKSYEDKGTVLEFVPEKLLSTTYWSSMSGLPDAPENYQTVSYALTPTDEGKTTVTITQQNGVSQESVDHSGDNWKMVLGKMKEILEK